MRLALFVLCSIQVEGLLRGKEKEVERLQRALDAMQSSEVRACVCVCPCMRFCMRISTLCPCGCHAVWQGAFVYFGVPTGVTQRLHVCART